MKIEIVDFSTREVLADSDVMGTVMVAMLVGLISQKDMRVSFSMKGVYTRCYQPTIVTNSKVTHYVRKA